MNRLLKVQLKKSFGKEYASQKLPQELQKLLELVSLSYDDFEKDRILLERTLDVSSQELTESNKEILLQHKLFESVSNSVSDIIFYKDLDLKYIGCNKKFQSVVGLERSEIIGKSDYDIFEKKYADKFRKVDLEMLKDSQEQTYKLWIKLADNTMAYISTLKSSLLDAKGNKIGIVGVSRDITKEHKLQEELKIQNALMVHQSRFASMGEMIGNIAHQWRQPLNALSLLLQNIEFAYAQGVLDAAYINRVITKGNRLTNTMSQTIDDFRNFFKPSGEAKAFCVVKSIESTLEMLHSSFSNNNIELIKKTDNSLCVLGSSNEFAQVLLNLLNNAKDALLANKTQKRKIFVSVFKKNDLVYIEVSDNAGGIKVEIFNKIFDPYFTTKDEGKGTGIGLYMSKAIIENNMHGLLQVKNIQNGVKFTIKLQAHECQE